TMSYPPLDITGKNCVVTGGTSGIGRAIALGFAKAGANVVAGSRNPEKVKAIGQELLEFGKSHGAVQMDVSDEASVADAFSKAKEKLGTIDNVVHAAGVI